MVSLPIKSRRSSWGNTAGFALVVTVTLLAFLVLLLVSLASLTRVETQVAGNTQRMGEARQNALMALSIAIGQLQKYAGPDQRITTTADLVATQDKTGSTTPDPLFSTTTHLDVQPGARFWTAVWGNTETNIRYDLPPDQIPPTTASAPGNRRSVTPGLLNWLVSGNESVAFTVNGTFGGVTPGTGITNTPDLTINLADPSNPTINNKPAVVLVGATAVGSASTAQQDYVVAPLVDINVAASSIPGGGSATKIGRYAWWIGDEGVKARINLQNGYQKTGQTSDQLNSFVTAQRSAVEFMDRAPAGTTAPVQIGTDFDFTNATVPNILTGNQLPLVNTASAAQARLTQTSQYRFHDITAQSFGVLSDTYAGGLKKDLTADIADTSANSSYRPANTDPVFTPISSTEDNLPTWGLIRNWVRTNPSNPGTAITPVLPSATNGGFYPNIAYFSMGYNFFLEGSTLKMALYPIISLNNPYPVPIAAADYDVGLQFSAQGQIIVQLDPDGDTTYTYNNVAVVNMNNLTILPLPLPVGTTSPSTFIRLRIHGQAIPPGERQLYVLPDSLHNTGYSHASPPLLQRAPDTLLGLGESNYITLPGPNLDLSAATPQARIRFRAINDNTSQDIQYTQVSLALAKDGSLAGSTWNPVSPDIYQAMFGVYGSFVGVPNFAVADGAEAKSFYVCATTAVGDLVTAKQVPPSFANSAVRITTGYEGGWSSHWKMGFVHGYYSGRFVADGCIRAPHIMATSIENYDKFPDGTTRNLSHNIAAGIFGVKFAGTLQDQGRDPHPFVRYYRYNTGGDSSPDSPSTVADNRYTILWDILDSPDKLLSLGQLQHVPFSLYDFQPSYLFGNSYANKRIPRNATYNPSKLRKLNDPPTTAPSLPIYDTSWLLNRALWDKYFVSGVPSTWTQADVTAQKTLPNARLTYFPRNNTPLALDTVHYATGSGANRAYDEAASNLLVAGAFNINSTSEQAWRAILASTYHVPINSSYANAGDAVDTCIPYPRFSHNMAQTGDTLFPARPVTMKPYPALNGPRNGPNDTQFQTRILNTLYFGNRGLFFNAEQNSLPENTSAQAVVAELARTIVKEIRFRGPFLSLADFINRPLTTPSFAVPANPDSSTPPDPKKIAGIKGVLQAGLDNMDSAKAQVNPISYQALLATGKAWPYYDWDCEHAAGGIISGFSNPFNGPLPADQAYRSTYAMVPKYLTQADLLSTLGPALSARSDTFTIRAYGEKYNPATNVIESRAWCEAVVQRTPDYIGGEAPSTAPGSLAATSASKTFGRAFKVISFRWLTAKDI